MHALAKLRSHSLPLLNDIFVRTLTSNETATALRPFYFAVHPDLFGNYPKERAVNEDSLKQLNSYLDGLHNNKRVHPSCITFFVRKTNTVRERKTATPTTPAAKISHEKPRTFREVRVNLLSPCPREVVKTVLRSCNLSLDYVESTAKSNGIKRGGATVTPQSWQQAFYKFAGIPDPFTVPKKPQVTLSSWLKENLQNAQTKQDSIRPVNQQIKTLRSSLLQDHGLHDVSWRSYWGPVQFRACLISLLKICEQRGKDLDLQGRRVVFSNDTGLTLDGDIMLRSDDVPDNWLRFLNSLDDHWASLAAIPAMEGTLSSLLNGVQVARWRGYQSPRRVQDYLRTLGKLVHSCQVFWHNHPDLVFDQSLTDIELVVACASGPLAVSKEGQILVPYSCPGYLLIEFLQKNARKAREAREKHISSMKEIEDLIDKVQSELELCDLTHDNNLDIEHIKDCCHHLLADPCNLGVSIRGTKLHITSFYSVMSDGLLCIPWNWIGVCDDDDK